MATTLINNLPINVPTGSQTFGPAALPDTTNSLTVILARDTTATPTFWTNASTTVTAELFVSLDGGVTFPTSPNGGAFTAIGGVIISHNGSELASTTAVFSGIPAGTNRQIQATVTVTNGPLVSQLTLQES